MKPQYLITKLEEVSGRNEKKDLIRNHLNCGFTEFFEGAKLALDSAVTFGVKKVPSATQDTGDLSWGDFLQLVNKLANREITGNAAQSAINHAINQSNTDQWNNWYRRILIKDLRCGVDLKTINAVLKEENNSELLIPVFGLQLAEDSAKFENKMRGQKLIQTKLDGVRVFTLLKPNGAVTILSRSGKELVNFTNIESQLSKVAYTLDEPMVLDGEVMSKSFQDLMKQVNRKSNVKTDDAVLNLFDMLPYSEFVNGKSKLSQLDRLVQLDSWFSLVDSELPNVNVIGWEKVDLDTEHGKNRLKEINKNAIEAKYEGIMIKDPDAIYEVKRSTSWLKMKPFIEVTLEVVDVVEGEGEFVGMLGALVCRGFDMDKQIQSNCGSGFSVKERIEIWEKRHNVKGMFVEIKADCITQREDVSDVWSLRFPRFKTFRGFDKGEKI